MSATGGASGNAVTFHTTTPVVCTASGSTVTFVAVGTCTVAVQYVFTGFAQPVDNGGVLNAAKAGQAIPLRWRLTDAAGMPVTTLTSASITATDIACDIGSSGDQLAENAAGSSGLQNLGDGYYQMNWKTPTAYARSCKKLVLSLLDGAVTASALESRSSPSPARSCR